MPPVSLAFHGARYFVSFFEAKKSLNNEAFNGNLVEAAGI
jgi:hypothetical protein